jgi:4-hydroxy-tetrahydrodipicolinate reductase
MVYRVAQWGTGNVGRLGVRGILEHPDLELVGLLVHSADKAGRDAGELAGLAPAGVTATADPDEIIGLGADCISYMATGDLRPDEAVADMARVLEAGTNVVSTSVVPLVYPPSAPAPYRDPLAAACKTGGASCFTSGIDPGFANDLVPFAFLGTCERVDSVRVMEILDYSTYLQADVLFDIMGFGKPLDELPLLLQPGIIGLAWGGTVSVLAAGLGAQLDDIREVHERVPAARDYETPLGTIAAGTTAGMRFEVQGMVGGEPRVVLEHVTRINDEVAPEWPNLPGQGGYRVDIQGNPSLHCQFHFEGEDGDHNTGGLTATAMRCLNAIPAVCEAEPGLLSVLDLPLVTGRGLLR